jgi:hypothetical protein
MAGGVVARSSVPSLSDSEVCFDGPASLTHAGPWPSWRACTAQVAFARRQLARAEDEARAQRRRVAEFVERRGWGAVAAPALGAFVLASLFGARPPVRLCSPLRCLGMRLAVSRAPVRTFVAERCASSSVARPTPLLPLQHAIWQVVCQTLLPSPAHRRSCLRTRRARACCSAGW